MAAAVDDAVREALPTTVVPTHYGAYARTRTTTAPPSPADLCACAGTGTQT
jgi:hypothetical protein